MPVPIGREQLKVIAPELFDPIDAYSAARLVEYRQRDMPALGAHKVRLVNEAAGIDITKTLVIKAGEHSKQPLNRQRDERSPALG